MNAPALIPPFESLEGYSPALAQMVAKTSWLPHQDTVKEMGRAMFPTLRASAQHKRFTQIIENGEPVGMYDDNTTPTWALLWAHGIVGGSRKGWAFAHIWPASDDITAYTHPANLAMVPECFASLTDRDGPLTSYLRWHAWSVYQWKPEHAEKPEMPEKFGNVEWRCFKKFTEPREFVRQRFAELDNERIRILRPIMERRGML